MYGGILQKIYDEANTILNKIETIHNFEYGNEFEIAICNMLKLLLPERYGVTQGYVISKDGTSAGDDIIIYDKSLFPEFRLFERHDLVRKQFIPIEAVYIYIECKHTIELEKMEEDNSIKKALLQIRKVRDLIAKREKRKWNEFDHYINEDEDPTQIKDFLPIYRNPPYTILLSRFYSINKKIMKNNTNNDEIVEILTKNEKNLDFDAVDLQVINESFLITRIKIGEVVCPFSVFNIPDSKLAYLPNVKAYGILFSIILSICDFINLKPIRWVEDVINEHIKKSIKT